MYEELKKAAERATQGKWDYEQHCLYFYIDGYTKHLMELCEGDDVDGIQQIENAKFIAASNPSAVLALIVENETLRGKVEHLECMTESHKIDAKIYQGERDSLKAENEALRKECARLAKDNQALLENPEDAL